ncbi:tRNA epoxyqueuosine(34) reductase QueG [Pedobacter sp. UYEF25]
MHSQLKKNSVFIKEEALKLGFLQCGIAKAGFLEEEAPRLEKWLKNGSHGKMSYMENYFDKRLDPRLLVDDAKSVISLALNYYPKEVQKDLSAPKISKYAYGEDYHYVIKDKLKSLLKFIQEEIGDVGGRAFVDSAPVLDRAWAKKAGIGWVGKNANIISKQSGSFFFLAELIIDLELDYDEPFQIDYCGTCTKCIDACPTDAIISPQTIDSTKCISYLTIELRDQIPTGFKGQMENWAFGCDICQDVCPWNRFSKPHNEEEFMPKNGLLELSARDLTEISDEVFKKVFKNSAVKRTKFAGLRRNLDFLKKQ